MWVRHGECGTCVCVRARVRVCVCVRARAGGSLVKNTTRSAYRLLLPSFLLLVGPGMVRGGRSRLRGRVIRRWWGVRSTCVWLSGKKTDVSEKNDFASRKSCDLWGSGLWGPALWGATGQGPRQSACPIGRPLLRLVFRTHARGDRSRHVKAH
jgi:hypothetical protein